MTRDTNVQGPLYASSQISQDLYGFSKIFIGVQSSGGSAAPAPVAVPSPSPKPLTPIAFPVGSLANYAWQSKVFAPYVDATLSDPPFDIVRMSGIAGTARYTLAFITADNNGKPSWGGMTPISSLLYLDQISTIRQFGGEVIISFGGAAGQELALTTSSASTLTGYYQQVIDAYSVSWVDFDVEGSTLPNRASVDRRNQAIRILQVAQPGLRISYTLPVEVSGLTSDGLYLLQSAIKAGVRVDVVNIMTMDFDSSSATNGATGMGGYVIQAATNTYAQIQKIGLKSASIGITPM